MAPLSDIPTEALAQYLESLACKLVEAGVPAERIVDAVKLTAVRVQALYPASMPEPAVDSPPDVPSLTAVLEKLAAELPPHSTEPAEDRPERRKAGRPWAKRTATAEPAEMPEETQPDIPDAGRPWSGRGTA